MQQVTQTAGHALRTIMLAGYADIAQTYAEGLRRTPGVVDFRILRTDGTEAFRDNRTIHGVNARLGSDEFFPREVETEVRLLDAEDPALKSALDQQRSVLNYTRDEHSDETLTVLMPIANEPDCRRCHGADSPIRRVIQVSSTLSCLEA
ncbi:MAG: sensor domain-containing diguanylate cyclase, partial [Gammaproteobacteria bacterium]|nr:sensor domain-containing diguanylate cyclase [Gammaproteobacteria bacterium]